MLAVRGKFTLIKKRANSFKIQKFFGGKPND